MKLIDLLRNVYMQTKFTIMEYDNDVIFINNELAFTCKGNIRAHFKPYLNYEIVFILADNKDKLKIYVR